MSSIRFGQNIQREFWKISTKTPFREVDLFRALITVFIKSSGGLYAAEYHGSKHQVSFRGKPPYARINARCELCDLLILTYSLKKGFQARITFLQAKRSLEKYPGLCASGSKRVSFKANLEQWDLLSRRPVFSPLGSFDISPNILSGALLPSVGSFGVFHQTSKNNFFYVSADKLKIVGRPKSKNGRLCASVSRPKVFNKGFVEAKFCCCIATFGEALYNQEIGTPILPRVNGVLDEYQQSLHQNLKNILSEALKKEPENIGLAQELMLQLEGEFMITDNPAPNLLIIRTDSDEGLD